MSYSSEVLADSPVIWTRLDSSTPITVSSATASSNYPGDTPAKAFDGDPLTPWTTNATSTGWLQAQLSTAVALTDYVLTSRTAFATRAPNTWTFEGSNDGSSWTTLDTRTGITWTNGQTKSFSFSNATAYLYYRLNVTANNGNAYLDVAELSFPYSPDSSGNGRYLVQPIGAGPSIASDGPDAASSMEFGASAGCVRSGYEQAAPTVGTFEFWVKFAANPAATLTLASWSPNNGGNGSTSYVQLLTNGKIRLGIYNGSTVNADSTSALTTDAWHYVVASIGAAGMKVRVDKTNTGSNTPTSANSPGNAAFRIHGRYSGAANVEQTGACLIADAAFYATQLSDARTDAHCDAAGLDGGTGTLTAVLPALSASLSGGYTPPTQTGALAAVLPVLTASLSGGYQAPPVGTLAAILPTLTASLSGAYDPPAIPTGTLAAILPSLVAELSGGYTPPTQTGVLDAILPALTVSLTGDYDPLSNDGILAAVLPMLTVSLFGEYGGPYPTDTSNLFNGLNMVCLGYPTLTRAAVTPPTAPPKYDRALPYPEPVMEGGRPT